MEPIKDEYVTIPQVAKILGLSRIAIFKKVKQGKIKAIRIGRNYAIPKKNLESLQGRILDRQDKKKIDIAIRKAIAEYGETLKLLGKD